MSRPDGPVPMPRLDCQLCQDLLEGYVAGQLGGALAASIERHYFDCRSCFELLQTYRAAQVVLQTARAEIRAVPHEGPGLLARLRGAADELRRRSRLVRAGAAVPGRLPPGEA